jgi:hypothetical protein
MLLLTSPRLPGISLLQAQSTSPEYSRWRRHIEYVLQSKGTWKYCNGRCTMPMPEAGATSPTTKTTNIQPSLLQERRSWVKCDREVKLDIFLSLSEEVMQEVFEVGPPLPPSNLNAQQMLQALDEHFAIFKFEAYHHVFCHFLNLHIDQYPSIEDFNQEFLATLEDLLDHGHPLSNIQACSAYFSKLRCTQNPWVAQKLEEWDAQTGEIECIDLLKDSPPWSIIRPLATKPSQNFHVESIPEEYLDNSSTSDNEVRSIETIATTASTRSLHSRSSSGSTFQSARSQESRPQRPESTTTGHSQEITIHASSEDIAEMDAQAFRRDLEKLGASAAPEHAISESQVPGTLLCNDAGAEASPPEWLASRKSVAGRTLPPPHDRPLPPLPFQAQQATDIESGPISPVSAPATAVDASPRAPLTVSTPSSSWPPISPLQLKTTHLTFYPELPPLQLEPTQSTVRPQTAPAPVELHPAFRPAPSPPAPQSPTYFNLPSQRRRPSTSTPTLAVPWPSTPDIPSTRPQSSRAAIPSFAPHPLQNQSLPSTTPPDAALLHRTLSGSSEISLPLQGTQDSAWDYLYESKGGYLVAHEHSEAPRPRRREPTYEDSIIEPRDLVTRLSGDNGVGEQGTTRHRKKKSWGASVGLNLTVNRPRFSVTKCVKEMI